MQDIIRKLLKESEVKHFSKDGIYMFKVPEGTSHDLLKELTSFFKSHGITVIFIIVYNGLYINPVDANDTILEDTIIAIVRHALKNNESLKKTVKELI